MKITFSTLSCPGWELDRVLEYAVKWGYDGVDIRGLGKVMKTDDIVAFKPENIEATKKAFSDSGVKLVCIGTSCAFHDPKNYASAIEEGKSALGLCAKLGVPYIRVFGNSIKSVYGTTETEAVILGIATLCDYADTLRSEYEKNANGAVNSTENGISVLLEVHGDFNTVKALLPVCEALRGRRNFGLIWDFAHSERADEDPRDFWAALKPYVKHVHVKDHRRAPDGSRVLCSVGSGDIRIKPTVRMMLRDGYDGYFALEHELAWHPELAPAEEEIPFYSRYMRDGNIMKTETWELCDSEGNGVGVYLERGQKIPEGLYHPVVEIWTKTPDGKILLTQRHPNKHYPLLWECSGGSIVEGEDFLIGASRELAEETGIDVPPEKLIYLGKILDRGCVLKSYLAVLDHFPDVTIQSSEVVDYKFVTPAELELMQDELTEWARWHYLEYKDKLVNG